MEGGKKGAVMRKQGREFLLFIRMRRLGGRIAMRFYVHPETTFAVPIGSKVLESAKRLRHFGVEYRMLSTLPGRLLLVALHCLELVSSSSSFGRNRLTDSPDSLYSRTRRNDNGFIACIIVESDAEP